MRNVFNDSLSAAESVEGSPRERGVCTAVGDQQVVEDAVLIGGVGYFSLFENLLKQKLDQVLGKIRTPTVCMIPRSGRLWPWGRVHATVGIDFFLIP